MDPSRPRTLVIDIGGIGIKMIALGPDGVPMEERARERTPQPATPGVILDACARMIAARPLFDRVSVGFPGVVRGGVVLTAPNLGTAAWAGHDLAASIAALAGRPARVLNDADLQGFGVIDGRGVELVITLGTGMGAGLFTDGRLVPNLELGHHPFRRSRTYEELLCDAELHRIGPTRWRRRVRPAMATLAALFNFDRLHVGGGNALHLRPGDLPENARIFDNVEGMRGGMRLWSLDPGSAAST